MAIVGRGGYGDGLLHIIQSGACGIKRLYLVLQAQGDGCKPGLKVVILLNPHLYNESDQSKQRCPPISFCVRFSLVNAF